MKARAVIAVLSSVAVIACKPSVSDAKKHGYKTSNSAQLPACGALPNSALTDR